MGRRASRASENPGDDGFEALVCAQPADALCPTPTSLQNPTHLAFHVKRSADAASTTAGDPHAGAEAVEAKALASLRCTLHKNNLPLRLHNIFGQHSLLSRQIMRGGSWVLALELPAVESEESQSARAITQTKAAERVEAPGLHPPPPPLAFNRLADLH